MAQVHQQTETAVGNEALSALLLPGITDIDTDQSQKGIVLRRHFAATRDAIMRQYPWNCCEREAALTPDPDAPKSVQFKYSYALPNNPYCLKPRQLLGIHRRAWKVRGRSIITNAGPAITLIFTASIGDVAQWDALLRKAIALALAVACKELCKDEETVDKVEQAAANALAIAMPVDATEGTPDEMPVPDVLAVRDAGCGPDWWDG